MPHDDMDDFFPPPWRVRLRRRLIRMTEPFSRRWFVVSRYSDTRMPLDVTGPYTRTFANAVCDRARSTSPAARTNLVVWSVESSNPLWRNL